MDHASPIPPPAPAPAAAPQSHGPQSRGPRHRRKNGTRTAPLSLAARRALVLAVTVPVAGTVGATAAGSAFAADRATVATAADAPDADSGSPDEEISENLDSRVNDPRLGTNIGGFVMDAESDKVIWGHNAGRALMPASNAKLATATAALGAMGPDHRFTTRVVYGDGTLTLVGGGDRLLTGDDVAELARTAAAGLSHAGVGTVKVRVDDGLFPEPSLANGWNDGYFPEDVAPVRPLVVDGHAVMDTSVDAGKVFADRLADQGVTVDGEVTRGQSRPTDVPVARHRSPKLSETVHRMLKKSDNNIAETLFRMTALATGRPATFEGGTAAVREILAERYGVPLDGFEQFDGSGLSRADRIPAVTIARILDLATDPRHAYRLGPVRDGLPVAGEAGSTLGPEWGRFDDAHSQCAVGEVSAKTGTLTGGIALSGLTKSEDGRWKVFSFVENDSTADPAAIKDAMDGLAATVNGCWS
ncbi:D-alanyl-D-alanine carboxypeptidase/D-alanyl-D-alanine-endopeptidase [Streptomyces sp. NPDC051776]|uniref:D-alanyl-D-alanine carboxypeptidase/D-alanyl-D-alanine endopeptidase n=1 Tax=Streptomyces sp. NPDC051776 TaxID=3155414 RepID=UPI0034343506